MFLENSQNSQENTCAGVSLFISFIKKDTLAQALSCEFCKISKNTSLTENFWWLLLLVSNNCFKDYSGISIKRTHYKADTSIRRTVWGRTNCFALWSNYLGKNLYKADISIKRTLFCTNGVCFIEIPLHYEKCLETVYFFNNVCNFGLIKHSPIYLSKTDYSTV